MEKVRVRFAPSPTGGLHIGGVRTALFNYLFAKKNGGSFILRIEDTDQSRFQEGAEDYIREALEWCGITPDESPSIGGPHSPYRQSERKDIYRQYATRLLEEDRAYYAFDSVAELETMRKRLKEAGVINLNYNSASRMTMKNSLTLTSEETQSRLDSGEPYVVRIKVPDKEEIRFNDMIRGWIMVHSSTLDDKVIMKSDGLPTYHLANIVDDHLMGITHVIRGEEWLPSAPLHVLLYEHLGWVDEMPKFAHLPLILKPDGNGKLSKRAADKAGFPIFPLSWKSPDSDEINIGFKETGFFPEALVNFLSLLGWNPGTDQEIFSMTELIESFSIERIGKSGTKFDIEKAKWFNQYYLKERNAEELAKSVIDVLKSDFDIDCELKLAVQIVELLRQRVTFPTEMAASSLFIFQAPTSFDEKVVKKKWNNEVENGLKAFADALKSVKSISAESTQDLLHKTLEQLGISTGKVMQILRLALTGQSSGPELMKIIEILGGSTTADRIYQSIIALNDIKKTFQ
jgi:glutamyl-tRNA synthetase